jgi:hypothetical protein
MCCFVLSLQAQNVTVQTSKVLKKIARLAEMSQDTNSVRYAHAWSAIRTIEAVYKNTPITKKQDEELAEIVCSALQSKEDKHFIIYVLRAQAVAEDYWAQNDKNE